jgi:hypothetical protein
MHTSSIYQPARRQRRLAAQATKMYTTAQKYNQSHHQSRLKGQHSTATARVQPKVAATVQRNPIMHLPGLTITKSELLQGTKLGSADEQQVTSHPQTQHALNPSKLRYM